MKDGRIMGKDISVQCAKLAMIERSIVSAADIVKLLIKYGSITYIAYMFFTLFIEGLKSNPESVNALANFCDHFKVGDFFSLLAALGGCVWGGIEHSRNKRLVRENGDMRRQLESNDTYKARSGLDKFGNAKEDEE